MKAPILLPALAFCNLALGQESILPASSAYSYQGPCCDASGNPSNPADPAYQVYTVRSFKKTTPVELVIKSITIGKERRSVDFKFNASIASETDVLQITDGLGVKIVLGQIQENKRNKYIYKLIIFRRDQASDCWRPLSTFLQMMDVYAQTISLNMYSIGAEGTEDFVRIEEAWMKLN